MAKDDQLAWSLEWREVEVARGALRQTLFRDGSNKIQRESIEAT